MMRMMYHEWEKLTLEQQNEIAEDNLPEILQADLENGLLMSQMVLRNGERFWEIQVEGRETTTLYPEYKQKSVSGTMVWYKFNPMWGYYSMNLTDNEPTMDEEPIGIYGMKWIDFMERNHIHLVEEMRHKRIFLTVARSVNETAWEYRELLDDQYMKANPRPKTFEEIVSWERTREFYTDGAVMRERVLIPRTAA